MSGVPLETAATELLSKSLEDFYLKSDCGLTVSVHLVRSLTESNENI